MKLNQVLSIVLGVLFIIVVGLFFIFLKNRPQNATVRTTPSQPKSTQPTKSLTPIQIPFTYTIKVVTPDQIILNGEKGDLSLPNDPSKVAIFFQEKDKKTPATLKDVKEGLKANLVMIPGVSAKLYLQPEKK